MASSSDNDLEKSVLNSVEVYSQKKHFYDIEAILFSNDSSEQHHVVSVHAMSLLEFSIDFAHFLFKRPNFALKILDEGFHKTALNIYEHHDHKSQMSLKENLHARLIALPLCPEIYRTVLPKCSDVGQFLCITGTIIRVSLPKMLEYRQMWRCSKCKYKFSKDAEAEQDFSVVKPAVCSNPDLCDGKNFTLMSGGVNPAWCKDYQEIKVQEQVHHLVVGTLPRSMWVILENDLVDSCQPGNDVTISGVISTRWKHLVKGCRSEIELVLMAHNVEVKNNNIATGAVSEVFLKEFKDFWLQYESNPLHGRDLILSCLCPQVFGLYIVKLAVALVLAGGVQRIDNTSVIRGDSHLLLVGDPGTGKSQFLKYASKISRRSVMTSGIGTTNAGLTAAAVKDGGKWQLEAGALVLADGGICCIDEFSSIKEQDKASIHEAMEQQTISVAKAGLVCKLSTQCSILASTNPKGKYNQSENLSVNTAMASPLLSRFDVILVLLDTYDESWDRLVSSYILAGKDMSLEHNTESSWSMQKMRAYFSAIKNIKPKLTNDCDRVLQTYYQKHRSSEGRSAARTTPRLLQSLIRLAQGHARLMFRMDVLVIDAIAAITVMESSMVGYALFEGIDALHTTFPDDPQSHYIKQVKTMLEVLELNDLLKKELIPPKDKNRSNALREIILTQMNPYFDQRSEREESPEKALIEVQPVRLQSTFENKTKSRFNASQSELHETNDVQRESESVLVNETSEESADAFENFDPFAGESDNSLDIFDQQNSAPVSTETNHLPPDQVDAPLVNCSDVENTSSSKYFSNGINQPENIEATPENDIRIHKENLENSINNNWATKRYADNLENPPPTKKNAASVLKTYEDIHNATTATHCLFKQGNAASSSSILTSSHNFRNRKEKGPNNKDNTNTVFNNISTISELNAIFNTKLPLAEESDTAARSSVRNVNIFESFAFKSKALPKTVHETNACTSREQSTSTTARDFIQFKNPSTSQSTQKKSSSSTKKSDLDFDMSEFM